MQFLSPADAVIAYRENIYVAILSLPVESVIVIIGGGTHISIGKDAGTLDIAGVGGYCVAVNVGVIL